MASVIDPIVTGTKISRVTNIQNRKAVIFGDSHAANHYLLSGDIEALYGRGPVNYANFLLNQYFDIIAIEGVGGENSTQILSRIWNVLKHDPGFVFIFSGTNDSDATSAINNMKRMVDIFDRHGITSVIISLFPRYFASIDQTTLQRRHDIRDGYRQISETYPSCILIDAHDELVDASTATKVAQGEFDTTYTADGTHLNAAGARVVGEKIYSILSAYLPEQSIIIPQWDGTNGDQNVVLLNGHMQGTGGQLDGVANTGVADSWNIAGKNIVGMTYTPSKVTRTDGVPGEWQRVSLSGSTASNEYIAMGAISSITNLQTIYPPGTPIFIEAEIKLTVSSGSVDWLNIALIQYDASWVRLKQYESFSGSAGYVTHGITGTVSGIIKSLTGTVQSATARTLIFVYVAPSIGASVTVDIGRMRIGTTSAETTINVA